MNKNSKITRREFIIKGSTITAASGLLLYTGAAFSNNASKNSKVIEVFDPGVVGENRIINREIVRVMVRKGLRSLTGSDQPFKKLINKNDVVGLKINTLGRPLIYTHPALIDAMVEELKDAGVPENNIIVWDRFDSHMIDSKFQMNDSASGVKYLATETRNKGENKFDPEFTYISNEDNAYNREDDGEISRFSSIFTKKCDKIINLAILKDHLLAGVTLCLKNIAYGITNNNGRFHGPNHIGYFITDVCQLPEVRKKVVLHVIDGIEGCFDKGPLPDFPDTLYAPQKIWFGFDPVALDYLGLMEIEAKRKEMGLRSIKDLKPATHIDISSKAGLGSNSMEEIDLIKVKL